MDFLHSRVLRSLGLLVFLMLSGWACGSPAEPSAAPVTTLSESEEAESDVVGEATFVIRDSQTLQRVWTEVYRGRRGLPTIDFSRHMIVIVTMGRKPTAGYAVRITGATRRDQRGLIVHVTMASPGPSCSVATVVTYPVAAARLPAFDGPVRFDVTRTTRSCADR